MDDGGFFDVIWKLLTGIWKALSAALPVGRRSRSRSLANGKSVPARAAELVQWRPCPCALAHGNFEN